MCVNCDTTWPNVDDLRPQRCFFHSQSIDSDFLSGDTPRIVCYNWCHHPWAEKDLGYKARTTSLILNPHSLTVTCLFFPSWNVKAFSVLWSLFIPMKLWCRTTMEFSVVELKRGSIQSDQTYNIFLKDVFPQTIICVIYFSKYHIIILKRNSIFDKSWHVLAFFINI
jgi:hypothetical protein